MGRDYSRIVSIAIPSNSTRVVLDGSVNDWYSRIRGNHQITEVGTLLISSPQQGRVFEVDSDRQFVLEIQNNMPGTEYFNYFIVDAIWLPFEALDLSKDPSCAG